MRLKRPFNSWTINWTKFTEMNSSELTVGAAGLKISVSNKSAIR